ncbi:MAG: nitrogenase [Clostridiales bacterium]|nr:nitrogenase [Clostridiales bacterium]
MLRPISEQETAENMRSTYPTGKVSVRMAEASFPAPFSPGLEFNSPAHGTWNIVHTGMLVPGAQQIYVCAYNCMRGVVLTAAEMNASDRFSFVILSERDLILENLEDVTIEGVTDVIRKLNRRPPAVFLFTVCVHHFAGCDLRRIYRTLETRFPDIVFVRCYMDPIMQKLSLTPDQKLRKAMYDPLPMTDADPMSVSLIGSDLVLDETSDLKRILRHCGRRIRETPSCQTWEEYLQLACGSLILTIWPSAHYGAGKLAKRLARPYLYLPSSFGYDEIERELQQMAKALGEPETGLDSAAVQNDCERALHAAHAVIGDTTIELDYTFHPRPLGLARLLLAHGFRVETVYLDAISREEEEDYHWLRKHAPTLQLTATNHVRSRVIPRDGGDRVLAIGQKAAWFAGTRHFVNLVQGGGLWGYDGIRRLATLMTDAFLHEKDTADLIIRKGWGCESCI